MYSNLLLTGGAGFIGYNLLEGILKNTNCQVTILDNFYYGNQEQIRVNNLTDNSRVDIKLDISQIGKNQASEFDLIIHLGAIASTDPSTPFSDFVQNNILFSEKLACLAAENDTPVLYASSAAIYGNSFEVDGGPQISPVNIYGLSKYVTELAFSRLTNSLGLRLFNIYGMHEFHKGKMRSVPLAMYNEAVKSGSISLFLIQDETVDGKGIIASRDFLAIDSLIELVLIWLVQGLPKGKRIIDVGSGVSINFKLVAEMVRSVVNSSVIAEVPYPGDKGQYQIYTQANLSWIEELAPTWFPINPEKGISNYIMELKNLKALP